ncbi:response regulator [Marinibacterium profundimaris]|uniref:response regulator n=1 Tax=Marinibacterium profundimaris TaxID=1679460 RepID=UPI000B529100|nr:response regulator [Marinibacterium profundimaris]
MTDFACLVAIVDDHAQSRRALARLLGSMNCGTVVFASGEAFLTPGGPEVPDLVLLDFNLAGLSGLELLGQALRRHPGATVLVITGREQPGMRQSCLDAGAHGFLNKPIGQDDLVPFLRAGHEHSLKSV